MQSYVNPPGAWQALLSINKDNTIFVIGESNYIFYANYIFEILMKQELKIISLSLQYD